MLKTSASFIGITFLLCAAILLGTVFNAFLRPKPTMPTVTDAPRVIVIDAGHGGLDGGASASDGTAEKEINLKIASVLASLMRISGYKVVMTRETDIMLGHDLTGGSAKMRDLKKRLLIASSYPDALTVSIHCNRFPDARCKGAQVYFSPYEDSERAAEGIRLSLLLLDSENKRKNKRADHSIYLLYRAKSPSVLVECGFLSNDDEARKLKTENYQKKTALCLMHGCDGYYS